jgi:hypothetical protein
MKKIIIICAMVVLIGVIMIVNRDKEPIAELKDAKFITKQSNNLNIYEYIHELTHSFVNTNKKDVEIIAPTNEARTLGSELADHEIYSKGEIETYMEIGYLIDKITFGVIDNDIIKLHDIVAKKSGDKYCKAESLNTSAIEQIVNDDRFFNSTQRECYNNTRNSQ